MSDAVALVLAALLVLIAAAGYSRRAALQPNRAGAAAYLAGSIAWGIALMGLWMAWAGGQGGPGKCTGESCTSVAESLESRVPDFSPDVFLDTGLVDLGASTD